MGCRHYVDGELFDRLGATLVENRQNLMIEEIVENSVSGRNNQVVVLEVECLDL